MVNGRVPMVYSKNYATPRRPFEKARLDQELKLIGEYGLRNKREVWRVKYSLAKVRTAARILLTLEEKDPKRLFEGNALLRRLVRIGVLDEGKMKLDYVLGLKVEDFLERRLQTQVRVSISPSSCTASSLCSQHHPPYAVRVHKLLILSLHFLSLPSLHEIKDTPMKDNFNFIYSLPELSYCRCSSWGWPSPSTTPVS